MSVGAIRPCLLVSMASSEGPIGSPIVHSGISACAISGRLSGDLGAAAADTYRVAPRPGSSRLGPDRTLEHGLCP